MSKQIALNLLWPHTCLVVWLLANTHAQRRWLRVEMISGYLM